MCLFRFPASCHTPDGNISSPVPLSIRSVPLSLSNKHPPAYVEYTGRSHRTKKKRSIFSLTKSESSHFLMLQIRMCCGYVSYRQINHGHDNMLSVIFSSPKYDDHVMQTSIVR